MFAAYYLVGDEQEIDCTTYSTSAEAQARASYAGASGVLTIKGAWRVCGMSGYRSDTSTATFICQKVG